MKKIKEFFSYKVPVYLWILIFVFIVLTIDIVYFITRLGK